MGLLGHLYRFDMVYTADQQDLVLMWLDKHAGSKYSADKHRWALNFEGAPEGSLYRFQTIWINDKSVAMMFKLVWNHI